MDAAAWPGGTLATGADAALRARESSELLLVSDVLLHQDLWEALKQ